MNDKKKKKFVIPEAEMVNFKAEDIIVTSVGDGGEANGGWEDNDNWERL